MYPTDIKYRVTFPYNALYPPDLAELTIDHRHHGIDLGTPKGTPIKACVNGIYNYAGYKGPFGYTVWIKFWTGIWPFRTTYRLILAHLSTIFQNWKVGDKIKKTEMVGLSGSSGSATYRDGSEHPHLHLEVQRLGKDNIWVHVDPKLVIGDA